MPRPAVRARDAMRPRTTQPAATRRAGSAYYALIVPGVEDLAAAELRATGATVQETLAGFDERDSVLMFSTKDIRAVLRCGLIDDVFEIVLDDALPPGHGAPKALGRALERERVERAMLAHHALRPKRAGRSYKVVARVAGRHPFVRSELELAFAGAMGRLLPKWVVTRERAAIELWAHVVGERAIVGIRLSGDELAQRAYKRAHVIASLTPTIARALVVLAEARPADVMLDPMAGAGTILRERAEAGRAACILGGDIDGDALAAARQNVGKQVLLARWDATRLPLRDGCIDAVITNPPYGRQHEAANGLDRLYARSLREAARVLKLGGRCVVLTGEPQVLSRALPPTLRVRAKRRLLLRGLPVVAFVLVRV